MSHSTRGERFDPWECFPITSDQTEVWTASALLPKKVHYVSQLFPPFALVSVSCEVEKFCVVDGA